MAHHGEKSIQDFYLDWLASAKNVKYGILAYVKPKADPTRKTPNPATYEEEVAVETTKFVPTTCEAFQNSIENGSVNVNKMISLLKADQHQQILLAEETKNQASSSLWVKHGADRITGSVAGDCVKSVKDNGSVSGYSHIARVMGYYGNSTSPSLNWGKNQEPIARKQYIAWHKLNYRHTGVSCTPTGLRIVSECPYVTASSDGLISRHQCGNGILEIKNPYTYSILLQLSLSFFHFSPIGIVPELTTRKIEMLSITKSVQKVISSILDKNLFL
ncbi:hypothetical protein HOLleu_15533 [Holothuria leucospilota]|uniref:YqaJ viral recombinase domain-containing protein n=1 Tax=Holothuria leucospilota TaxID=206669 RepID=A0A9Q1CAK9_HOLLE|nr:hypothetical protein HOLleu_15533 [Holothuria leucospilota]